MAALGGAGEGLDAELVRFGLQGEPSETNQVTGSKLWARLLWTDWSCVSAASHPSSASVGLYVSGAEPQGPKPELRATPAPFS